MMDERLSFFWNVAAAVAVTGIGKKKSIKLNDKRFPLANEMNSLLFLQQRSVVSGDI